MQKTEIQKGAEIRVAKGSLGFEILVRNPGESEFQFYAMSFDHKHAEQKASELAFQFGVFQTFKTEGHYPRKREMPDSLKEWMD